jgi:hypothetical protein
MKILVGGAENVPITKYWQFQRCLNRAWEAATTQSDTDEQKARLLLQNEIHHVLPAKCKSFNKLFHNHERPLLQDICSLAISSSSIFAKKSALMHTATNHEADRAAERTPNNWLQCPIHISDTETDTTTLSLADTECVTKQLKREIYIITINEEKQFHKEISILWIEFEI